MKQLIKKHGFDMLMVLICIIGVLIVAYPSVSDYWNSKVQSKAISDYKNTVAKTSDEKIERMKLAAKLYNQELYNIQARGKSTTEENTSYEEILNINGDGIMGYLVIPAIDVQLPVYHGTEEKILQVGAGHSDISSLPIGGENTHAVILGHRGLPSARLFSDFDQLVVGDYFEMHVLNDVLYYEIYDIAIVEPKELNNLRIKQGEDLITLVTCTPYGVNTHRLLVYGRRIDSIDEEIYVFADAKKISYIYVAIAIGGALWLLAMIVLIYVSTKHGNGKLSYKERMRRRKILSKYQKEGGNEDY